VERRSGEKTMFSEKQIAVTENTISKECLLEIHRDIIHPGQKKMMEIARKKGLNYRKKDIIELCSTCMICQTMKSQRGKRKGFMQVFPTPSYVGEQLSLDITGPIEFETGKYYLLIIICRLSRYVWYYYGYNYPNTERMSEFVRSIHEDLQEKTRVILTDRAPCFSEKQWQQWMSRQEIEC
jgi:Integrase core domain/Integrase zinc binding domain